MKEIKDNSPILVIMTCLNLIVLWNYIANGQTKHGIGYFCFFYAAIITIHFFTKRISPKNEIVVKEPKREASISILFALLGALFLALNFMLKSNTLPASLFTKLPIIAGNFLFTMPIGIFIYLLIKKYKIGQLGLTIKPATLLLPGVMIWALTGLFAIIFYESGIIWEKGLKEVGGVVGLIFTGIINAALFEEFSRFIIQSRLEKLLKTTGINILLATIIWAFMHFPMAYNQNQELASTFKYCLQIIPIGFIWGYLTQRTKSILPSVIAHGLNLWGFQNG
ncbi:MAG: CPBP family intramembrane glutamic endopeptidase [Ferruginibacter sp.]